MQETSVFIKKFHVKDAPAFWKMLDKFSFHIDRDYYERCIDMSESGDADLVLVSVDDLFVGYCLLNFRPKYSYFQKCGLPEIQDLNVLSAFRRRGIGRAVIEYCEDMVKKNGGQEIGIGVGLDSSFGAAQRLYARLGYIPDGAGVTYDRKPVAVGEFRPIDGNLSLMMTKSLS